MVETTGSSRNGGSSWSLWSVFVTLFCVYVIFSIFGRTIGWIIMSAGAYYFLKIPYFTGRFLERIKKNIMKIDEDDDDWSISDIFEEVVGCGNHQPNHVFRSRRKTRGTKFEEHEKQNAKGGEYEENVVEMKEIKKKMPEIPKNTPIAWKTDMGDTESGADPCMYMSAMAFAPGLYRCGFEGGHIMGIDVEKWCKNSGQVPVYIPTRIGYHRDGHRYPHRYVHPNDELGQKQLQDLKEHWASKRIAIAKPITNFLDDETPLKTKKCQE